jgi:hypothetical protein
MWSKKVGGFSRFPFTRKSSPNFSLPTVYLHGKFRKLKIINVSCSCHDNILSCVSWSKYYSSHCNPLFFTWRLQLLNFSSCEGRREVLFNSWTAMHYSTLSVYSVLIFWRQAVIVMNPRHLSIHCSIGLQCLKFLQLWRQEWSPILVMMFEQPAMHYSTLSGYSVLL